MQTTRGWRWAVLGLVLVAWSAWAQAPDDPCEDVALGVLAALRREADAGAAARLDLERARERLVHGPSGCQSGLWYLAVAHLLRAEGARARPIRAGDLALASAREALTRGLERDPYDARLLAFIAWLAGLYPADAPPLPEDTCERVLADQTGNVDLRAYACGVAAKRHGRLVEAEEALARVSRPEALPDANLRLAEVRLARGDRAGARVAARQALADLEGGQGRAFGARAGDLARHAAVARELLKQTEERREGHP